jgi:hypothetical protein
MASRKKEPPWKRRPTDIKKEDKKDSRGAIDEEVDERIRGLCVGERLLGRQTERSDQMSRKES